MAQENVKLFKEALQKDTALQAKLKEKEAGYSGDKEDRVKVIEKILLPLAAECGLPFTIEELKAEEEAQQKEGAVSEEELESVSGGQGLGFCFIVGAGLGPGASPLYGGLCFGIGKTPD